MNNTIEQDDISTLERRIKELKSDNYNDQFLAVFKRIQAKLINHKKAIATLKVLESAEGLPEKKTYQNTNEWCDGGAYLAKGFNDCRDLCQIPYAKQILKNEELQEQLSNWLQLELDYNKRIKELEAKIKEIEKSISDVLTQRDMWKTDYAELQAENKKLKRENTTLLEGIAFNGHKFKSLQDMREKGYIQELKQDIEPPNNIKNERIRVFNKWWVPYKKLKEQQLTEDEIVDILNIAPNDSYCYNKDLAKAIIKAREEKQTRTCDPECPFCKTEEASK